MDLGSISYVKDGAQRHVTGDILPFDQRNEMFKRPFWDPQMLALKEQFYFATVAPKDKPGYTLTDQALVNAAWRMENEYGLGIRGGRMGFYAWDWDGRFSYPNVPEGLKINVDDPGQTSRWVKKAARLFGAAMVGVCELDRRWIYSKSYNMTPEGGKQGEIHIPEEFKYAVVIAVEMDYTGIKCSPANPASDAVGTGYSQMVFTTGLLAQFIRGLGFDAIPCGNDTGCSIPIAIDAGLGEIARNGLLITPEYGPRVRLAKIFTNLPLLPDKPIEFGVTDFCMICEKCAKKCPSQSIMFGPPSDEPHNISNRKGVNTWHINAKTCLTYWARNGCECSNCIRTCPFNKPAGLLHKGVRWGVKNLPLLNRLFLKEDDFFGYGSKGSSDKFWED